MDKILIELDAETARELNRIAPPKQRKRAEFIRLAIRRALDLAQDRQTAERYAEQPISEEIALDDLLGWDQANTLAKRTTSPRKARTRKTPRAA